jgi:hypothetical protein
MQIDIISLWKEMNIYSEVIKTEFRFDLGKSSRELVGDLNTFIGS